MEAVAKYARKTKLATESTQYAKRLVSEGFDTVAGIANLDVHELHTAGMGIDLHTAGMGIDLHTAGMGIDLHTAGMRIGDAKCFIRNVSARSAKTVENDSERWKLDVAGHRWFRRRRAQVVQTSQGTGGSGSLGESYAIVAAASGAAAAFQAVKSAKPKPELKGKANTVTIKGLVEWMKKLAKRHSCG